MSRLIEQLKKEHRLIAEHLQAAYQHGAGTKAGHIELIKAKNALLGHLKKEDQYLYPPLREAAKRDANLAWTLELYAKDMQEVTRTAIAFFEKYIQAGSGLEFGKDFGALLGRLKIRISNEENELYKEYEKLKIPEDDLADVG